MISKIQIIKKIQKPIDFDLHLKYSCPCCSSDHWIKFLEATVKNFKIVCDCGAVFRVKRLEKCKLIYNRKKDSKHTTDNTISKDITDQAVKILESYGFSQAETDDLIKAYAQDKTIHSVGDLVKKILESMRI